MPSTSPWFIAKETPFSALTSPAYPHLLIAPAVMISVMILVFNLFGDGLRDAFDPKLKN